MTPFEHYRLLERRLLRGRALGTLSAALEDAILEEMDPLWYAMTDTERAIVDAGAADVPSAPKHLGVVDTGLDQWPHRRAA